MRNTAFMARLLQQMASKWHRDDSQVGSGRFSRHFVRGEADALKEKAHPEHYFCSKMPVGYRGASAP
jgi:hypothetical protein